VLSGFSLFSEVFFLVPKSLSNIPIQFSFVLMFANGFVYDTLRGLARNLANKNRIENPRGFS
jgi:ABC-type xylose transport system permease subunit